MNNNKWKVSGPGVLGYQFDQVFHLTRKVPGKLMALEWFTVKKFPKMEDSPRIVKQWKTLEAAQKVCDKLNKQIDRTTPKPNNLKNELFLL